PTPTSEPLTSEFILEEIEAYLKDDSISPEIDHVDCDPKGDICLIEKLLNNDPFQLPLIDLNQGEIIKAKPSIEEPPKLELKDLPSHLEYAYLEENNKLPVIIAKSLKDNEKEALLKVLKSHKRAIAWKIIDIKGIDPRFCTYKILMEDDYKPTVQSQRQVNPKIHEVIKKEVLKLLDARMIYPISDSPWVSLVHCVPKKGGITVVANEENELWFPAQSVGSSNTDVLDSPCLLVLITGTSQSRQHVITSLIHIESCKSPTKSLFDVGSSRISIFPLEYLSITQMFWQDLKILRRTLFITCELMVFQKSIFDIVS
ncbi:hypothetical protein Tco_0104287, partial [Tanacetum coccineum]